MKAFVIGLDGATFEILTPLMQAGYLPNLQKAFIQGASGELRSTVPPVTALAWSSFMTGKNPGKHGLLSWQGPLNERFERPWVSGKVIRGTKLWHLTGEAGLRACVVNVPVTYPPEPLNGAMITGLLTPGLHTEFTYPPDLKPELLQAVPDYQIDIDVQNTQRDAARLEAVQSFLNESIAVTQARGRAIRWLLAREQPDLAVAVFELPDRLQHILWRQLAELTEPEWPGEKRSVIHQELLRCFQILDEEIGLLLAQVPSDAYVVFLSDHGFGPLETLVHLNHWLAQQGWLAFDRRRAGGREMLRRAGRRLKRLLPASMVRKARQSISVLRTIDWTQTVAYGGLPSEYGLFLNVKGREPAGIVEPGDYETLRSEIMGALRGWRDPRTGQPIMKAVYRREEVYTGPFVEHAADIVFEFQRGYKVSHLPYQGDLLTDISAEPSGFHEPEGILAMSGPGIAAGTPVSGAYIQDVLPTLLYALDLPVPDDLDGRVLTEIFEPAWQSSHPQRSQRVGHIDTAFDDTQTYSAAEEALIEEQLKGLGYLE